MPGWTLVDTHPTQGRTFQRPLSVAEHLFFVDQNGRTADIARYLELRLSDGARDANLLSDANIVRAWVSAKRRYPLAGAIVQQGRWGSRASTDSKAEDGDESNSHEALTRQPYFVVRECDLSGIRPGEVVFEQVTNVAEALQRVTATLDGPHPLSNELLARLYVFRETGSEEGRADILHALVLMSHSVADEMASRVLVRCLLDTLSRGGEQEHEPAQVPLEDRLAMAVPVEELNPVHLHTLSPARKLWRRAAAAVIVKMMLAKMPETHTLPYCRTRMTLPSVACTRFVETSLTQTQSAAVIDKCRQHKITFGNAYIPLAQVAMTRVLYRRYLRGEISEEEWARRRKQPYVDEGHINMRPYLDKAWLERGGGGEFVLSMTGIRYKLPFMTLGHELDTKCTSSVDGAPSFSDLLTFDRFLHRAKLIKKQAAAHLSHPLFFEINDAICRTLLGPVKPFPLQGKGNVQPVDRKEDVEPLAIGNITHCGGTLGNMDLTFPFEYPLSPTHALSPYSSASHPSKAGYFAPLSPAALPLEADMAPKIVVEHERFYLHPRDGTLYLSAVTWRGQMKMCVYYGAAVFEEEVVREWLDEVKEAVLWYLGTTFLRLDQSPSRECSSETRAMNGEEARA